MSPPLVSLHRPASPLLQVEVNRLAAHSVGCQTASVAFEERLAQLELTRLRAEQSADSGALERVEQQLSSAKERLHEERAVVAQLRQELTAARCDAAERGDELRAALAGLHEARDALDKRTRDCSHWRAEAARAVGQLEALTSYCERQAETMRTLQSQRTGDRDKLLATRASSELQHQALVAARQ